MYSFSSKLWYDKRWISKSGDASLYLQVNLNGKHKEFPLKLKWPVDNIDMAEGRLLKKFKGDPDVDDYNLLIKMEQGKHTEILRTYRIKQRAIDINIFSKELRVFNTKESFVTYFSRFSKFRYETKDIVKRTYLNHLCTASLMVDFHPIWSFDQLDVSWMKRFKKKLMLLNYEPGYIWSTIKTVKTYLKYASKEPLIYINDEVVQFPNPEPNWKTEFLTKHEVKKLMALFNNEELTSEETCVLNAFLFQCFTSLRISDVYRVNAKWRLSEDFLDFIPKKNKKNKKWVHIPIMPIANTFIKNTLGNYFTLPTEQRYNAILKGLAIKADIKKRLTSHVGRHTFGHLYITKVGNLKALQENMGHVKIETTARYAHLDDEYKTESVLKIQDEFSDVIMRKVK